MVLNLCELKANKITFQLLVTFAFATTLKHSLENMLIIQKLSLDLSVETRS